LTVAYRKVHLPDVSVVTRLVPVEFALSEPASGDRLRTLALSPPRTGRWLVTADRTGLTSVRMNTSRTETAAPLPAARRHPPWLLPVGLLLILALLTVNVLANGPLIAVDRAIRGAVQAQADSATWRWIGDRWYSPARLLAGLGNNQAAVPVLAVCAAVAARWRRSLRPLIAAAIGVVLLLGTVIPAKILIARAGPGLPPVRPGAMGVFPSGHACTSSVCLGLGAVLVAACLPALARHAVLLATAALCILVGAALIWCDFHWFTDVIAGWALSGLIIMAALRLARLSGNSGGVAAAIAPGAVSVGEQTAGSRPDD
jgi:membrane-associated phospholipid phosphatase